MSIYIYIEWIHFRSNGHKTCCYSQTYRIFPQMISSKPVSGESKSKKSSLPCCRLPKDSKRFGNIKFKDLKKSGPEGMTIGSRNWGIPSFFCWWVLYYVYIYIYMYVFIYTFISNYIYIYRYISLYNLDKHVKRLS